MLKKLHVILYEMRNKSGLMKYINGDDDSGKVKTKKGKRILCLNNRLDEIYKSELSVSQKMEAMEQAVLDIYLQVREDQGWRDSKLANALEDFLKSKDGLNIEEKYEIKIPHKIMEQESKLDELGNLEKEFSKLSTHLDTSHLTTKRKKKRDHLLSRLNNLNSNSNMTDHEKIHAMQVVLSETWDEVQSDATNTDGLDIKAISLML